MEQFAADPMASFPKASLGWNEMVAAHRFFDDDVDWHADGAALVTDAAVHGSSPGDIVLGRHDTTGLQRPADQGAGTAEFRSSARHVREFTYAVTPERTPLGVLNAWMWARTLKNEDGQRGGPKESLHWIEGHERTAEAAPALSDTRLVYVADREADLMPLMSRAQQLGTPANGLVRAKHNRCLLDGHNLWPHTTEGMPLGEITFQIPTRKDITARRAARPNATRRLLWPGAA